jgi:hypothetical protein
MTFALKSPAFRPDGKIPENYAQEGQNISPPLVWSDVPRDARSLILFVEDPDAPGGTFYHWAGFDIDPKLGSLAAGAANLRQGINDMGHPRYDGPRPPEGDPPHHYHFRLAALDIDTLDLPEEPSWQEIKSAARGHVIAQAELVGLFESK